MNVPVIGIVENMGGFVCPHCGELTEIFGRGGGERFAREHGIEFLGWIPLDVTVRQGGDVGIPAVAQREPGPAAAALDGAGPDGGRPDERRGGPGRGAGPVDLLARRLAHGGAGQRRVVTDARPGATDRPPAGERPRPARSSFGLTSRTRSGRASVTAPPSSASRASIASRRADG